MVDVPPAGQRVKLEVETRNGQTYIEGVVLHPAAKNHLTVKLVNGYNASYPLNEVTSVELLPTQSPPAATNAPKQERVTTMHFHAFEFCILAAQSPPKSITRPGRLWLDLNRKK